jgi:hypothetical protein
MRWVTLALLMGPLALMACGDGGGPPQPAVEPSQASAAGEKAPAAGAAEPEADRVRGDILSALAAHPAGLKADSTEGRAVLDRFRPADCLESEEMDGMPFERICAWWSQPRANRGSDISVIIDDGLILGAVVRNLPEGVEGWDCQPAAAPPDYTICMATRVSSAQSVAWSGYWNDLARS